MHEYKEREPSGYQYSYFCDLYRQWHKRLDLSIGQERRAGEKLFVDYCGQTLPIVDPATGEILEAPVFVALLGASNFTYAEATRSQALPNAHVRAFAFLGGVPKAIVPDNLRSGVTKPCRYEPEINVSILRWQPIMARPSLRHGFGAPRTRLRWRWAFRLSSASSWPDSDTAPSSPWPRPMPPSENALSY